MNEEKEINNVQSIDLKNSKPILIQNSKNENNIDEKERKFIFENFQNTNQMESNINFCNNSNSEFHKKPENHLLNLNLLYVENNKMNNPSLHISEIDSKEQKENYNNLKSIIELRNKNNENLLSKKNSNSKDHEINNNNVENNNNLDISNIDSNFERKMRTNLSQIGKTSKIKLHEFYINNNLKNKELNHKNNKINTTKYNPLTFLPKSLLIQFARLPNIYFLSTAIIQSIPIISPLSSITAIFPLIFVLAVSMIRDLIEDLSRLKYDNLNNNEEVIVYRENKFIKTISSSLNLGELIIVLENKQIPADMILIDSNLNDGMAFVETSTLDGEKNLKPKISNNNLCGILNNLLNSPEEKPYNCNIFSGMKIDGFCQCDPPNADLHKLDGTISVKYNIHEDYIYKSKFPISERQMLLKGSILKNTNWIAGFVLYTGMNNKIILNSRRPRTKISLIEKKMNKYLSGIFFLLIILCIICSVLHAKKYNENKGYYEIFILLKRSHKLESFITFFTYFLLLNTLIPISLIITLEIVKIIQGFFISWDAEMYSSIRNKFAKAKTVSINEELGNVNYIFSDKTGTLTSNKMIFKYCIIQGKCYEYDRNSYKDPLEVLKDGAKSDFFINETLKSKKKKFPIIKFPRNYFIDILKNEPKKNFSNGTSKTEYIKNKKESKEINIINEFWTAISITHECVCTKIGEYSGVSPDDVELVKTAHEQGYSFMQSSNKFREIRIGDLIQTFEVLNILNFSSERKRMSIIIKDKNGIIKLYSKGADSEIIKRMSKNSKDNIYSNFTFKCVDKLSCKGFRSLLIAYKIIEEEDYIKWNKELKNSEMNLAKKDKLVDKCYDKIEQELELIGATVVEDKLQDLVPETIKDLRMAGIKIWVLTGDKVDTAENIALSCNLISKNQKIFRIFMDQNETERSNTPEIDKFFQEYNDFMKKNKLKKSIISNIKFHQDSSHINSNPNSINNKIINNQNILNQENKNGNIMVINNIQNMNPNSIISSNNLINKSHSISQSIDQLFPKEKNTSNIISSSIKKLESPLFSIIIESPLLSLIFSKKKETNSFLKIASKASSVICCRVSPFQKSLVIQQVKKFDKKAITVAIGDGGNDVSMIMEAHLGIGIYGEEGMRAVQASDFAIGEFKFLRRLLFFHGRTNNNRISKMILYFFYKNFVFSIVQFVYAFFCVGSGQTLIDDWFITCYNLIFTALPLGVQAVSDFDILESDHDVVKQFMPLLYKENRDIHPIFSLHKFVFELSKGFIYSFLIFYIVCFCDVGSEINNKGDYGTLWYMSLKTYTSIIISVNLTLFLNMRYITFLFPLTMGITSFLLYIIFIIIVEHITMFNSCASIFHSLSTIKFYLSVFLVCSMSFLSDYMRESININFSNKISTNLLKYILDIDSQDNFMEGFVKTRKKYSETFQMNYLEKKAMSKLSIFSNSKDSKNDNILDLNNSNDETFKKAKSSQLKKFHYTKEKINHKNFYETMFEGKFKSNESSVVNEDKKGVFFKPNEKWINTSKIKLNADNKKLEIPHFQLNSHI